LIFPHYPVLPGEAETLMVKRTPTFDLVGEHNAKLAAETERWAKKALEKGPGWNVWRSNPITSGGDAFFIVYHFSLLAAGDTAPGAGVIFNQPDLSDGERARLIAGRYDWQDDRWEDECGVLDCGHPCCESYRESRP
jgi:hypothetical protein